MVMRQRGSGYGSPRPRQTNRPIYEDFQPMPETKEEGGAQVVVFRLPGKLFFVTSFAVYLFLLLFL